jgi:hypothetical protein
MAREWARAEIGVRLFPPVPADFDPVQASADELRAYGYPPRPDAALHRELYEHWSQAISPSMTTIEPRFVDALRPPVAPPGPIQPGPPPFMPHATSSNWAGSVNFPDLNDGVVSVAASWVVPDITGPGSSSGDTCAQWVGMDGWGPDGTAPVSADIVQAGTTQTIDDSLAQQTFAWWEWVPRKSYQIENFTVAPGDQMFCVIRALSPTEASFFLVNMTSKERTLFWQSAPDLADVLAEEYLSAWPLLSEEIRLIFQSGTVYTLSGASADWVLEWPGVAPRLANFGTVEFDQCVATTAAESVLWAGRGQILTMVDAHNIELAAATAPTDSRIRVTFTGGGPTR